MTWFNADNQNGHFIPTTVWQRFRQEYPDYVPRDGEWVRSDVEENSHWITYMAPEEPPSVA